MTDPTQGLPPAGWYPDPAGGPQQRWWDGGQWSETLQPVAPTPEPVAVSQPIAFVEPVASVFPFEPLTVSQPIGLVEEPKRSRTQAPKKERSAKSQPTDDAPSGTRGRLQYLALLTLGLVLSVGGFGLFAYGSFVLTDPVLAGQNQMLGAIIAGFGVFSMLLWLAAGAIRNR